jgi:iron complex transport system substrate-binding protein
MPTTTTLPPGRPRVGRWVVAATAMALVAGCSSRAGSAEDQAVAPPATATVDTAAGEVTVDVTRERVWALDELAALQLLALGVKPLGVGKFFDDKASAAVLADAGVELSRPEDVEVVAAARPRLIVGVYNTHLESADELGKVAPVVVVEDFQAPWTDQLSMVGEVTGTAERASALAAKVEKETEELAAEVAKSEIAGSTVSVLAEYSDGTFITFDQTSPSGLALERLGLERPPTQVNDDDADAGFVQLSAERLGEHGGEVILSHSSPSLGEPSVLENPVFRPQAQAAEITADVEGTVWNTATPLSAWWILQDLRAVLVENDTPAALDTAPELWADLMSGL